VSDGPDPHDHRCCPGVQCHLMLPNCSPALCEMPRRAKGEDSELPSVLLGSECGLWCSLLTFPTPGQAPQLQVPHHKCLQLHQACSEKNTDPSCLAPDFRVPSRVSLTFSTQLLSAVLKNNCYNPAGLAATVLWMIW